MAINRDRVRLLILLGIVFVSTVVYSVIAIGGRPGPAERAVQSPNPLEVALTQESSRNAQVDQVGLEFWRLLDDESRDRPNLSTGYISIGFTTETPAVVKLVLAVPSDMDPKNIEMGPTFPQRGTATRYSMDGREGGISDAKKSFPGLEVRDAEENGDRFRGLLIPLNLPAGKTSVTVEFWSNLEPFRYRESWGRFKYSFGLQYTTNFAQAAFKERPLVSFTERSSPEAFATIGFIEAKSGDSFVTVYPDPEDAGEKFFRWKRDIDSRDSRFLVSIEIENSRTRYWLERVPDLLLLILGGALGIIAERYFDRARSQGTTTPAHESSDRPGPVRG